MAKTSIIHARTDSNHLPSPQPTTTYGISGEQLDAQLQKGMEIPSQWQNLFCERSG